MKSPIFHWILKKTARATFLLILASFNSLCMCLRISSITIVVLGSHFYHVGHNSLPIFRLEDENFGQDIDETTLGIFGIYASSTPLTYVLNLSALLFIIVLVQSFRKLFFSNSPMSSFILIFLFSLSLFKFITKGQINLYSDLFQFFFQFSKC